MSDNNASDEIIINYEALKEPQCKLKCSHTALECKCDIEIVTSAMNKSIQIDMDSEPGDDPKKNKKYWQDTAGHRGAREQYLRLDNQNLVAVRIQQTDYINYLQTKLAKANEELKTLKANCRCQKEVKSIPYKPVPSLGI